ncbi:MAG: hypothetical protein ACRCT8_05395 [Lacipirellulaceae bacterium]
MPATPSPPASTAPRRGVSAAAAPWLMTFGVVGIAAHGLGIPAPVLTCLLLVGLGADADLARRAERAREAQLLGDGANGLASWDWAATPLRFAHASLYALLYVVAWGGMAAAASSFAGALALTADLAATFVLLLGLARRA